MFPWMHESIWWWVEVHTGTVNESGPYYGFWSGFGSDLGELTLITAVAASAWGITRKHNCHVRGCWRVGRHGVAGTEHIVCSKHHPTIGSGGLTAEQIQKDYEDAK